MNDRSDRQDERIEHLAKRAFDRSVAALDGATRARLAGVRARAIEETFAPRPAWRAQGWGFAAAAAAAAAIALSFVLRQSGDPAPAEAVQLAALGDLEILAGDEELELLEEELAFYAWLEQQPELAPERDERSDEDRDG